MEVSKNGYSHDSVSAGRLYTSHSHENRQSRVFYGIVCVLCPFFPRRKVEIMHTHSLFTLLGERLMLHTSTVTVTTYNTLYEVRTREDSERCTA